MRSKTIILVLVIFIAILNSCKSNVPLEAQMTELLTEELKDYDIHGVSAAVVFPSGKLWRGVSGISHDTVKIKTNMFFGIGSITKNVVAALTLKLCEEKLIALNDPISMWLDDYPYIDGNITIKQLLNHTSGLYMFWDNEDLWDELERDKSKYWTPEEVLKYIKEPYFFPGEGFRYSNTNYLLLAMIIVQATNTTLSEALRDRFWQPLGIKSVFHYLEEKIPDNLAHIYGDDFVFGGRDEDVTFIPRTAHESITYGSAGLFFTAEALALWCHSLFEGDVLNKNSMNEMLQFIEFSPISNMRGYGLGVQVYAKSFSSGETAIGHGGANIGTSTYMVYLPEFHVSLVVMINEYPNEGIDSITKGLINLILKEL
jgi:D-alanyl-D-alanine carboxypeptidase